ncbi:hypothetical protein [uncultured Roseobacter sp.]|uniref:hypothetical protein n=1 Tax=uncultured Roseobacter sp. TaxID=114847 RepID=UPI0026315C7D|nr:hypothetical protein [uncultured Roseobacter sp.]
MREPTSLSTLLEWYNACIEGGVPPRVYDDEPQCGWFKMRFRKNSPWQPCRIWMDQVCEIDEPGRLAQPEELRAEVAGRRWDPIKLWTWYHPRPIPRADYNALTATLRQQNTFLKPGDYRAPARL